MCQGAVIDSSKGRHEGGSLETQTRDVQYREAVQTLQQKSLQVKITVHVNVKLKLIHDFFHSQYQFGDIIAFSHTKKCSWKSALFKRYAIYVGKEKFDGKGPDQDIFPRTGKCN